MTKEELRTTLNETETQDRDILGRVIAGFKSRDYRVLKVAPEDKRLYAAGELNHYDIAEDLGITHKEAANRLVKLMRLQLVEQRDREGWVYIGGPVSEFFEVWNELEFC
jgi:predicted transcriptional regulator